MSLTPRIDKFERNLLINGDMFYNQRGTSVVGTGSAQYLIDRWTGWFPAAGSYTSPEINWSSLPSGFPGNASVNRASRLVANTVDALGSFNRYQRIESVILKSENASSVSFGFYAWVSNMQECLIQIIQPTTGSDDDWASFSVVQEITIPVEESAWKFYEINNVPLLNTNGLEVRIVFRNPANTAITTDTYVTQAMFNTGAVVRPFRLRTDDRIQELMMCQRYYEKSYNVNVVPGSASNSSIAVYNIESGNIAFPVANVAFRVEKRIPPTTRTYSPVTGLLGALRRLESNADISSFTNVSTTTGFGVGWSSTAVVEPLSWHWTADAEL